MKNILVPIDGSEASIRALEYAIKLVQRSHQEIILVNVQPNFQTPNVQRFFSQTEISTYQKELAQSAMAEAIQLLDSQDLPYRQEVRIGSSTEQIIEAATDHNVSSIIMGSRGAGAIKGKLIGSVSYGVLHEATCPVTIVK